MVDIATLGIRVESQQAVKAASDLDKLAASAKGAETAAAGVGASAVRVSNPLKQMSAEAEKAAKAVGGSGAAVKQLGFQLNDLGTQIAGGGSPLQALAQQGGQIFQVWQQSPTVFGDTARAIGGVLTPVRLLAAGAIGAGAAALFMAERFKSSQREVERSLAGSGRASGIAVDGINAIADAESNRARVSRAAAREIAAAYAASGNFNAGSVAGLTGLTRDFGAQTGRDQEESISRLSKALSSPSSGLRELALEIGGVDAKTIDYIRSLEIAGEKQRAVQVAIDAVKGSVDGAANRVSFLTKAWQGLTNAASNAADSIGRSLSGQVSIAEKLQQLTEQRSGLSPRRKLQIASIDEEIERIKRLQSAQEDLTRIEGEREQNNRSSLRARDLIREFDTQIEQVEKLKQAASDLDKVLSNGAGRNAIGGGAANAERAVEAYKSAIATTLTLAQRTTAEGELQVRSVLARTAAEQLSVDLERTRLQLAGQVVDAAVREQQVRNQIAQAQAQASRELRDAQRGANDNLSLAGLLPYQRALKQIEIDSRGLRERTSLSGNAGSASELIKRFEGFRERPYYDVNALRAGYGSDTTTRADGSVSRVTSATTVSRSDADRDLNRRIGEFQNVIRSQIGNVFDSLSDGAKAALTSIAYNYGSLPRNVATAAKTGDGNAISSAIAARGGDNGGVNASRRSQEAALAGGTAAIQQDTRVRQDNVSAAQRQALAINEIEAPLKASRLELEQQRAALALQEQGLGLSSRALASTAKEQELLNQFQRQGVPITDDLRAKVKDLAGGYGDLAVAQKTSQLRQDLNFERDQIGRSPGEQQDASRLRSVFGNSYKSELNGPEAAQLRTNRALEQGSQLAGDFFNQLSQGALSGKKGIDIVRDSVRSLASQFISLASQQLGRSLFGGGSQQAPGIGGILGSLFGGGGGGGLSFPGIGPLYAKGGAFNSDNVIPFARGGAFTNSIVSQPTIFPFANGGAIGLMGEAGPEAIMPLQRGADGSLGVAATGASSGGTMIVQGETTVMIQGNADSAAIAQMRKELAERDRQFARNVASANRDRQLRNRVG